MFLFSQQQRHLRIPPPSISILLRLKKMFRGHRQLWQHFKTWDTPLRMVRAHLASFDSYPPPQLRAGLYMLNEWICEWMIFIISSTSKPPTYIQNTEASVFSDTRIIASWNVSEWSCSKGGALGQGCVISSRQLTLSSQSSILRGVDLIILASEVCVDGFPLKMVGKSVDAGPVTSCSWIFIQALSHSMHQVISRGLIPGARGAKQWQ
jgi:hypothetical protein